MTRKWIICSLLLLSLIPVLLTTIPASGQGYGGGGGNKTTSTTTTQPTTVSTTSVPEHIDLTLPLLTTVGLMVLLVKRKEAKRA